MGGAPEPRSLDEVAELRAESARLRRELEAALQHANRMDNIGRLAGGIAHDFNNILTAVLGHCEALEKELGSAPSSALEHVHDIRKAGDRAAALARHLLGYARTQAAHPRPCNLNDFLKRLAPLVKRLVREDIEVALALEPGLPAVVIDPLQLEQVVINLAVNASDAMPAGGRLELGTSQEELRPGQGEAGAAEGRYAVLRATDTGAGMDQATLERLFEPFFTTKQPGKGTGLGLATCRGIVEQCGGFIRVVSRLREGTTFLVFLPLRAGEGHRLGD